MLENIIFTLSYVILSAFLVYPPDEFVSAGFTIPALFSGVLGTENENFILYHLRRSVVTLLVYSCLPLGYIFLLIATNYIQETADIVWVISGGSLLWRCFFATSLILPLVALYIVRNWTRDDFQFHPICLNLIKFSNSNNNANDWRSVASVINAEFRRIDKISIQTNPLIKIIATENWILKVNPFTILVAHQSDTTLLVKDTDIHDISAQSASATQFLKIEVKSTRSSSDVFHIRINSSDFKDLEDRIARDIAILPNVKFHKSVIDEFADVFKETIAANAKYESEEGFDECIGCMQARPNVKLRKLCGEASQGGDRCENCFCRPMWCADCMAKWFASRQEGPRSSWLSAKATCPMCRARFCLLDVSLIDP